MGRGLSEKHHQYQKRKKQVVDALGWLWHKTQPTPKEVGVRIDGSQPLINRCRCEYCSPQTGKRQLIKHQDSHGP